MLPSAAEIIGVRQPERIARLIFLSTALFITAAGFTLFLSSVILEELSRNIHFSAYRRVGERVQLSVARGLRFGRSLDGYSGLGDQLDRARNMAPGIVGLAVVDVNGSGRYISGIYPDRAAIEDAIGSPPAGLKPPWRDSAEANILVLPLAGRAGGVAGYLIASADPEVFRRELKRFWMESLLFLLAVAVLILLGQFIWVKRKAFTGKASNRYWLCLLFAGGGQLLFGLPLVWIFSGSLVDAELAKVSITARTVAWDLDRLAAKTPRLKEIRGVDTYLDDVRKANPEIAAIRLRQGPDTMVAAGGDAKAVEKPPALTESMMKRPTEAETPGGGGGVSLEFWLDSTGVRMALRDILLTLATSLVISLLLLNELARFFTMPASDNAGGQGAGMSRMLAFVFFIAYDMSLSFIPLAAGSLPGGMWPFPDSMRTSLPLAVEAATAGLGILAAGRLARTGSARSGLFIGAISGALGALIAWRAPTAPIFAGAFAVSGFGFGTFLMSCQAILLEEKGGAGGVAELYSGLFSGSLCGMAAGAMAAELFGFRDIFAVSMLCYLPAFLIIHRFGPRGRVAKESPVGANSPVVSMPPQVAGEYGAGFYLSWPFLSQVVLAAVPMAMSLGGLIFLSLPTLLNRMGAAQGDTGRVLMLYGLCFVFIGPRLGRRADSGQGYAPWIAGAAVLNGAAVLCVGSWPSFVSYAAAALIGGVACSLMTASGMARVAALSSASGVSAGYSGGLYRFVERMAQIVGPLLFGLFLSTDGTAGFLWLGILFVAAAGLFYFTAERGRIGGRGD